MNISIRKCTIQDLDILLEYAAETFYQTFAHLNTAEDMERYIESAFNEDKLRCELENPDSSFFFLFADGCLAGYMKLNEAPSQTDINDSESLEIERIYISRDFQSRGLGRYLMQQAVFVASERGKKYIWLGVWEKNEKAICFYKKNGFSIISTHSFFLGEDEQTDYIMRRNLK